MKILPSPISPVPGASDDGLNRGLHEFLVDGDLVWTFLRRFTLVTTPRHIAAAHLLTAA